MPEYVVPDTEDLTEDHVRDALDFLVAIEPVPTAESREAYEAAIAPYEAQIAVAMATLRRFAEQTEPSTIEQLRSDYYGFVNDARYRMSPEASSVIAAALNRAWHGVGPWRQ